MSTPTCTATEKMTDSTKTEQVILAVFGTLLSIPANPDYGLTGLSVLRNAPLPEEVPPQGRIILRDGAPVIAEPRVLGGFAPVLLDHAVPIEIFVTNGDDAARDAQYNLAVAAIGAVLPETGTLDGLVFSCLFDPPEPHTEPVPGAAAVKAATLTLNLQYEAPSALG